VHLLPLMQERGLSTDSALSIVAMMGPSAVAARIMLFYGPIGASARATGRVVFPMLAVGLLVLIASAQVGYWGLVAFAVVFGMSNGVLVIVRQTAIAEIFGVRGFGAIAGAVTTVSILPRTGSPLAVSALRDYFGGYGPVIWVLVALMLASTAFFYYAAASASPREP
jgi:hypothetical protein